jgi:hypothetical protein
VIVLGVVPGLSACAYSVVAIRYDRILGEIIDCDVLHGNDKPITAPAHEVARSARVHQLVLSVVVGRDPPAALAIGPPYSAKEPDRNVNAVRATLEALVFALSERVRIVNFETELELREAFEPIYSAPVGERTLKKAVRSVLRTPIPANNRRIMVATAAALAAAHLIRTETGGQAH